MVPWVLVLHHDRLIRDRRGRDATVRVLGYISYILGSSIDVRDGGGVLGGIAHAASLGRGHEVQFWRHGVEGGVRIFCLNLFAEFAGAVGGEL